MGVMELEVLGGGNGGIISSRPSTQIINHIWGVGNYSNTRGIIYVTYFYAWGSDGAMWSYVLAISVMLSKTQTECI